MERVHNLRWMHGLCGTRKRQQPPREMFRTPHGKSAAVRLVRICIAEATRNQRLSVAPVEADRHVEVRTVAKLPGMLFGGVLPRAKGDRHRKVRVL